MCRLAERLMASAARVGLSDSASAHGVVFPATLRTEDLPQMADAQLVRLTSLEYAASAVSLRRGDVVTVNGVPYTVRESARLIDGGSFALAELESV